MKKTVWILAAIGCASLSWAQSQEDEKDESATQPEVLESITVTATKMGESKLQETPLTATAVTAETLEKAGVENTRQMAGMAPGVQTTQNVKWGQLFIRGIGTNNVFIGSDPSSTIHLDGVYLSRPTAVFLEYLDLERVEVLRGPQGTLYGRNSVGGTMNLITRKPGNITENKLMAGFGNYGKTEAMGRFSGPLVPEKVMASFSFLKVDSDGYVDNINPNSNSPELNDEDTTAARASFRFLFGDSTDLVITADYSEQDDQAAVQKPFLALPDGTPIPGPQIIDDPFTISTPLDPRLEMEQSGITARLETQFGDLRFTSITAFRNADFLSFTDADYTELDSVNGRLDETHEQITQEFQLNGSNGKLNWVAGLFYLDEDTTFFTDISLQLVADSLGVPSFVNIVDEDATTEAWAIYLQGDYHVNDQFWVTAGMRYSDEEKTLVGFSNIFAGGFFLPDFSFDLNGKDSYDALTPKFGLNYQVNPDTLVYLSATRGFKSGGFNWSAPTAPFDPEFLWSYELGLKSQGLDDRLRFNASAFLYDYTDLQVQSFIAPTAEQPNAQVAISNAADAEVSGLELELSYRAMAGLTLHGSIAYLDATYKDYIFANSNTQELTDVSGNRLNNSPEWSYTFILDYNRRLADGGNFNLWADYRWQDRMYFTPLNQPLTSQGSYDLANINLSYRTANEKWQFSLYGKNLGDEVYYTTTADFSNFGVTGLISEPLTYGARASYNF